MRQNQRKPKEHRKWTKVTKELLEQIEVGGRVGGWVGGEDGSGFRQSAVQMIRLEC